MAPAAIQPPARPCAGTQTAFLVTSTRDRIPSAGPFGIGLDGFINRSCVPGAEVHNSVLQVSLELGWFAAVAFASMIIIAATPLLQLGAAEIAIELSPSTSGHPGSQLRLTGIKNT